MSHLTLPTPRVLGGRMRAHHSPQSLTRPLTIRKREPGYRLVQRVARGAAYRLMPPLCTIT